MTSQFNKIYLFAILIFATLVFLLIYNSELKLNISHNYNNLKDKLNDLNGKIKDSFLYETKSSISSRIRNPNEFRKFAILSVSIVPDKDFYYFQLPMIVKAWERMGYKTIVIIVAISAF